MGDLATYEARLKAEIPLKGNDKVKIKNTISFYFDAERDDKDKLIEKIIKKINQIGTDNIVLVSFENLDDWLDREDDLSIENIKDFLENNLDCIYDYDEITIEYETIEKINKSILDKLNNLKIEYNIINLKAEITISSIWESIYCDNDNRTIEKVDKKLLLKLLQEFKNIKIYLEGDGYGSNC